MNKQDFCRLASEKCGFTKKEMGKVIDAFIATVEECVAGGDKVQLIGFGAFAARKRSVRTGINPRTGEAIEIPAAVVPVFKAGKAFKELVKATHPVSKPGRKKVKNNAG